MFKVACCFLYVADRPKGRYSLLATKHSTIYMNVGLKLGGGGEGERESSLWKILISELL